MCFLQSKAPAFGALEESLGSKDGLTEHEAVAASLHQALKALAKEVSTSFAPKRTLFSWRWLGFPRSTCCLPCRIVLLCRCKQWENNL